MKSHSLEHVSVWVDDDLANQKGLTQALDWASRLDLPLYAVVSSQQFYRRSTEHAGRSSNEHPGHSQSSLVAEMKALGIACNQRGITLEMFMWLGDGEMGMNRFLRSHGLCVCVDDVSSRMQKELLLRSTGSPDNAVLMCANTCGALTRILVLYDQSVPNPAYLESAARFCQSLGIQPIILIVANTEHDAQLRRGYAEGVCNSFHLIADFDCVIGCDVRSAVTRVAAWRRCSHLIIKRWISPSWWQRSPDMGLEQFRGLADSLSLLALPEAVAFDVPRKICNRGICLLEK